MRDSDEGLTSDGSPSGSSGLAPAGADGDEDAAYLDGGLTLAFGLDAQLDARAGAGLTHTAADWFFGVGFARRF